MKMKKLLATTAVALVAMASTASAQSVLERVLGQIDNSTNLAQVNGTFANIAENIGGGTAVTVYTRADGEVISEADYDALVATVDTTYAQEIEAAGTLPSRADYADDTAGQSAYEADVVAYNNAISNANISRSSLLEDLAVTWGPETVAVDGIGGIDGSITNIVDGIADATQTAIAGSVSAVEFNMPTLDFGDMATTALGAVNTGDITLGVNSSVDNAKTTSTEAVSSVMAQLGGSADTGAIVLNIASNMTGVNGSISNTMTEVNGTVGNLSTTALGAVNTGTIISGVNAAVTGITGASSGQSGL